MSEARIRFPVCCHSSHQPRFRTGTTRRSNVQTSIKMDSYSYETRSDSPDVCNDEYDDVKVEQRIVTLHHNVASDRVDQVICGLEDLMNFTSFYYDDGKSRDSFYYEKLLIPELMQRLRDLFFEPFVNKLVASVMDSLIPENWQRVVDPNFALHLSTLIQSQKDVDSILCSAALLVRKFVAYGDDYLKVDLCKSGLVIHMAQLLVSLMYRDTGFTSDEKEFAVHTIWAAGELLPAAHRFDSGKALLLYQLLKLVLQSPDQTLVSEVVAVMDLLSFSPNVPQLLHRNSLTASLLLLMMRPEYQSIAQQSYSVHIFHKCLQIVHTIIQSDAESRDVVLQDIRQTWTMETFFSFLIKDYKNRVSCETELAVLILRFVPLPELLQLQLIPSVVSFVWDLIVSEGNLTQHPRQPVVSMMQYLLCLTDAAGPAAVQLIDSGVLKLVTDAMRIFRSNEVTISLSLQLVHRMLTYPDVSVRNKQVADVLSCRSLMLQIEELIFRDICCDLSHRILKQCNDLSPGHSGDIMHMMTTMRLG